MKHYALARATTQKGEVALQDYQKMPNGPPLPSSLIGNFYSTYALTQTKNGEAPDVALELATDSEPSNDPIAAISFTPQDQIAEVALIYCYHGDQSQATRWIEKRIDLETLAPRFPQSERGRIYTINLLTLSLLKSKERDMERILHHWTAGIEGARALKNELRFSQAVANFEAMEVAFPGEPRIKNLREHIVRW
jgi:hypothetical protein